MRIQAILHAAFEPLGIIEEWAEERQHDVTITRSYDGEPLPNSASFDFLILMGGPQSSLELKKYPYLREEIALIKQALNENKLVLGVCLGAQLIGDALGAKPERSPEKEVGVFPIELTSHARDDALLKDFPEQFDVMHWHNDMPGLPSSAQVLARSRGCPRQIVRFSPRAYGFQCHFEVTASVAQGLIDRCPSDLSPSRYVQSADQILQSSFDSFNHKMKTILDRLSGQSAP